MLRQCKAEITIKKVDNGYVVEWEQEKPPKPHYSISGGGVPEDWRNPSGVRVFATLKQTLDFVKDHL